MAERNLAREPGQHIQAKDGHPEDQRVGEDERLEAADGEWDRQRNRDQGDQRQVDRAGGFQPVAPASATLRHACLMPSLPLVFPSTARLAAPSQGMTQRTLGRYQGPAGVTSNGRTAHGAAPRVK